MNAVGPKGPLVELVTNLKEERDKLFEACQNLEADKRRLDWVISNPWTFYQAWLFSTFRRCPGQTEMRKAIDLEIGKEP
jgi:hypothetical protein